MTGGHAPRVIALGAAQGPLGLWLLGEVDWPGWVDGCVTSVVSEDVPDVDVPRGLLVSPGLRLSVECRPFIPPVSEAGRVRSVSPLMRVVSVRRIESSTPPESVTPAMPVSA